MPLPSTSIDTRTDMFTVNTRECMARLVTAYRRMGLLVSYERDNWMGRTLTVRTPSGITRIFEYQP